MRHTRQERNKQGKHGSAGRSRWYKDSSKKGDCTSPTPKEHVRAYSRRRRATTREGQVQIASRSGASRLEKVARGAPARR
eukprot:2803212-Pleurochrysis_carterae.AAC.3